MPGRLGAALANAFAVTGPEALTDEDRALLSRVADEVVRRGMALPARITLLTSAPLRGIGGQVLHFLTPYMDVVGGGNQVARLAEIMERKGGIEVLTREIEEREGHV